MPVDATTFPVVDAPQDTIDRVEFICSCIHTRLTVGRSPLLSPFGLLLSLCGNMTLGLMERIEFPWPAH